MQASGHRVEARNLLTEPWTADRLRAYFGAMPVAAWFNRAAPRVKEGIIRPESYGETEALAAMLADPLLIRRPLIEALGRKSAGFDLDQIKAWIGLAETETPLGEACARSDGKSCSTDQ